MLFACTPQDFPSASQIAQVLEKKSASVIFAVMPNVFSHYERLRALIGSAEIGALENKSSNIIKLIRNNYDVSIWRSLYLTLKQILFGFLLNSSVLCLLLLTLQTVSSQPQGNMCM